jgi:hypothetical protein
MSTPPPLRLPIDIIPGQIMTLKLLATRTFIQSVRSWARRHGDRSQGEISCPRMNLPPQQA